MAEVTVIARAATNARADRVDTALCRPGRLIRQIHVGRLSRARAQQVLKRLSPDRALPPPSDEQSGGIGFSRAAKKDDFSLAEVYDVARGAILARS